MKRNHIRPGEGHIARIIAWLTISAMVAFFWIAVAGVALRLLLRRG